MVLRPFGHHAERADVAVTRQRVFFIPTVAAIENKGQTIVRCTIIPQLTIRPPPLHIFIAEYYFVVCAYDGYAESSDSDEVHYVPS